MTSAAWGGSAETFGGQHQEAYLELCLYVPAKRPYGQPRVLDLKRLEELTTLLAELASLTIDPLPCYEAE